MMNDKIYITTDATSDFPKQLRGSYERFKIIPMTYFMGNTLYDGVNTPFMDPMDFYREMEGGAMPQTALITTETAAEFFSDLLDKGFDVIHISFSSALSGTCAAVLRAAEELKKQYPERKITVIDSLAASAGEGLLNYYVLEKRQEGASYEEIVAYAEDLKKNIVQVFLVDDLFHLYRGGRISKSAAVLGEAMQLKPVLHVSDSGRLEITNRMLGRKLGLQMMINKMADKKEGFKNDRVFIGYGNRYADALLLAQKVGNLTGRTDNIIIDHIGPVIGAHVGSGVMALFFLGKSR
ncbi:MAG: DegV family protein [Clostridiaceae bacterium]|jgi:DegV family protein with EDD domain|nr:DegV family protein [Clostridiaceae bacterium]